MPVIEGYSRKSFEENRSELARRLPESQALAASYNIGRKAWRRRHGKTAPYPPHLREPHGHLLPHDNPGSGEKVHSLEELRRHGLDYWKDKPTISSGQTHNLKFDDGRHRVWVTRMTPEDYDTRAAYENEKLVFERHFEGRWHRVHGPKHSAVAHGGSRCSPAEFRDRVERSLRLYGVSASDASAAISRHGAEIDAACSNGTPATAIARRLARDHQKHESAPSETPGENVYWRQIPVGAPVIERRYVFIAKRADGKWAVANWEGREALEAQQSLRRWARAGKRTR